MSKNFKRLIEQYDTKAFHLAAENYRDYIVNAARALNQSDWKSAVNKHMRFHYSHNNGDAMFVIPPYPFAGEVENYNFFLTR